MPSFLREMRLDKTITYGHLLTILGFFVSAAISVMTIRDSYRDQSIRIDQTSSQLADLKGRLDKLSDVVVILARQDERLNNYETRISYLENRTTRIEDRLDPGGKSGPR